MSVAMNRSVAVLNGTIPITLNTTVAAIKENIPASVNTNVASVIGNMPVSLNTYLARTEPTEQQGVQPVWTSCPSCYSESVAFDYTYVVYCLLLLLVVAALVCIKLGVQRRNELIRRAEAQSRAARLRALVNARDSTDPPNNNNRTANNNNHNSPKEDLPPAYDDIMTPRFMAKQSFPSSIGSVNVYGISAITPAVTNHLPATSSSFSTVISNDIELDNMTSAANNRSAVIEIPSRPEAWIERIE